MRVTKAMIEAAQRAEVEFLAANRPEFLGNAGRPLTRPDLMRAILQAAYAVGFPPRRQAGHRKGFPHER